MIGWGRLSSGRILDGSLGWISRRFGVRVGRCGKSWVRSSLIERFGLVDMRWGRRRLWCGSSSCKLSPSCCLPTLTRSSHPLKLTPSCPISLTNTHFCSNKPTLNPSLLYSSSTTLKTISEFISTDPHKCIWTSRSASYSLWGFTITCIIAWIWAYSYLWASSRKAAMFSAYCTRLPLLVRKNRCKARFTTPWTPKTHFRKMVITIRCKSISRLAWSLICPHLRCLETCRTCKTFSLFMGLDGG